MTTAFHTFWANESGLIPFSEIVFGQCSTILGLLMYTLLIGFYPLEMADPIT